MEQSTREQKERSRAAAQRTANLYAAALVDVVQGKNLDKHLQDVTKAIAVVETEITKQAANEPVPASILKFKNELWFLKWQILEKS